MLKRWVRFFTIADYEEEEIWLRDQHKRGWRLVSQIPPCFFVFEACTPQDVIYRLDYKNNGQTEEYMQMVKDFGWEYAGQCLGWLYFRKPAEEIEAAEEGELFSDSLSRVEMASRIVKTRLLPLAVIFLCVVLPNLRNAMDGRMGPSSGIFGAIFGVLFVLDVFLLAHCGIKLNSIRDKYRE